MKRLDGIFKTLFLGLTASILLSVSSVSYYGTGAFPKTQQPVFVVGRTEHTSETKDQGKDKEPYVAKKIALDQLKSLYQKEESSKSKSSAADKHKVLQIKASIDPNQFADPKTVSEKYVAPVLNYGKMSTYNWESPDQILADDLINICVSNNYLNLPTSLDNKPIQEYGEYLTDRISAKDIEAAIQKYFPVASEYLKTSQYYDSKTDTYQITEISLRHGRGRGISAKSAAVSQNQVRIQLCISNPPRDVGTLTMELLPDGRLVYSSLLLDELELCNRKYIQNTLCSDLLFSNWENADQIIPDALTIFYLENNMDAPVLSRDEEMRPNQLPEDVESYIKQYFDVSTEQIRKSHHFDPKNQVYHIWGIGSVLTSRVTAVKTEGKFLMIDYQLYREGGTPENTELLWKGTVTIEQKNDGGFFYRSCFGEER